jgi:two-component system sensor kinase FixL
MKKSRLPGTEYDNPSSLLAAIAASSNDAIVGKDLAGTVTSWNAAAELLFGYTATDMIGQSITRIIPPELVEEETAILARVSSGEKLTHFETKRLTRDGRSIPVSLTISPIHSNTGEVIGISKIARDLTEAQRAAQALQQREALLQSILDTVPDGVVVIDEQGVVQSFSPAAERMFGYTAEEIVGRNVNVLMPAPQAAAHDSYLARYLITGERRIIGLGRIVVGRRKDSSTFPMELQIAEVLVPGAHRFTGFVRDLTERQERDRRVSELQSELIHVSRLSELGQMVSALAHEVDQPLTAMTNYLSGVRRLLTDDSPAMLRQGIQKIDEQAIRARDIIRSLRNLVKRDSQERQVVSLEATVQETAALALIGKSLPPSLDLSIPADAARILVDKVQIQQVLLNLMRNAVEAMEEAPVRQLSVIASRRGDRVEVQVADTGLGLSDTIRARLFQPFVTTKADGLGVGLSICRTIIEGHGGELTADDRSGSGTIFRFSVPASPPDRIPIG